MWENCHSTLTPSHLFAIRGGRKRRTRFSSDFQLTYNIAKFVKTLKVIIHAYLFTLQSLVNVFVSSFYFDVNSGKMHTRITGIISLNTRCSIVKKM